MPSSWAVAAAKRILLHLDIEDFPHPLADIIDRSYALGNPLIRCGECGGRFSEDRVSPASAHPEAAAVCDSCLAATERTRELTMEREAHQSSLNRCKELRDYLEEARGIMDRYRDCRRFGVGMLHGPRIHLDDEVRSFLDRTGGCPIKDFEDIAANNSTDPLLSNIEQAVRDGLSKNASTPTTTSIA